MTSGAVGATRGTEHALTTMDECIRRVVARSPLGGPPLLELLADGVVERYAPIPSKPHRELS
jgi:hypothetical protein